MRKIMLLVWLLLPILAGAYHYGPGQEKLRLDQVDEILQSADRHAQAEQWTEAVAAYDAALTLMPGERERESRRVRLERAKAQMFAKKLPLAHLELKTLVDELQADATADPKLAREARSTLANSRYYMTWLMRLEGKPREQWQPEIDAARQTYRLLAEEATAGGDEKFAKRSREDLESSIRLARMDLSELQGLPLPSQ